MAKTWIYLMFDPRGGYYKIGRSNMPCYREKTLQAEVPVVRLMEAWRGRPSDEKKLHTMFADKRLRGEWFALNNGDLCEIRELLTKRRKWSNGRSDNEERLEWRAGAAEREKLEGILEASACIELECGQMSGTENAAFIDLLVEGFGVEI